MATGEPLPLHPVSRPRPITDKDLNGSKQSHTTSFHTPIIWQDEDSERDKLCVTNGNNHNTPTDNTDSGNNNVVRSDTDDANPLQSLICYKEGYNPVTFFSFAYFCAAFVFLLMINIPMLPNLLYPTIGNLLPLNILHRDPRRVVVLIVLWGMHYVRRFGEVLLVHVYRRSIPLWEGVGSIIYYSFFGLWIAWSINYNIDYLTPPNYIFLPGICLYFIGATGNLICHLQLRAMRRGKRRQVLNPHEDPESEHIIPYVGCFNFVSCPHYLFEIITWLGFALATFTLAAWMFFVAGSITLVVYAQKRHKMYKTVFHGRNNTPSYPRNRKCLIPLLF